MKRRQPTANGNDAVSGVAERLQKVLAGAGLGSRREIEGWITAGRVRINDRVASLGDRVLSSDRIKLDNRLVPRGRLAAVPRRVIVYHKPEGEVVSRADPEGRPTVFRRLPRLPRGRWIAVGRLDLNTSGLLILTTDGELANRLMHPTQAVEREYAVRVLGEVGSQMLERLRNGVTLEDGEAHFEQVADAGGTGANRWYHVVLREGRKREVRRLWEAVDVRVSRLIRIRFGNLELGKGFASGRWRELSAEEIRGLLELAGYPAQHPAPPQRPRQRQPSRRPRPGRSR